MPLPDKVGEPGKGGSGREGAEVGGGGRDEVGVKKEERRDQSMEKEES